MCEGVFSPDRESDRSRLSSDGARLFKTRGVPREYCGTMVSTRMPCSSSVAVVVIIAAVVVVVIMAAVVVVFCVMVSVQSS